METFKKDPDAKLDFGVDWSDWLEEGEAISSVEWDVQEGLTKESDSQDGERAEVWLSGGEVGEYYTVTCSIVTSEGREDDRSFILNVEQR